MKSMILLCRRIAVQGALLLSVGGVLEGQSVGDLCSATSGQISCLREEYQKADALLNRTYGETMRMIGPANAPDLKTLQRKWVSEKMAEERRLASDSISLLRYLIQVSSERTDFLNNYQPADAHFVIGGDSAGATEASTSTTQIDSESSGTSAMGVVAEPARSADSSLVRPSSESVLTKEEAEEEEASPAVVATFMALISFVLFGIFVLLTRSGWKTAGNIVGVLGIIILTIAGRVAFDSPAISEKVSAVLPRSNPETIEQATRWITGTWTARDEDIEPNDFIPMSWSRYDFRADGTFSSYGALATDDDWPKEPIMTGTWTIVEAKYIDTGERYLAVDMTWLSSTVTVGERINKRFPIVEAGLRNKLSNSVLKRGDHFPH